MPMCSGGPRRTAPTGDRGAASVARTGETAVLLRRMRGKHDGRAPRRGPLCPAAEWLEPRRLLAADPVRVGPEITVNSFPDGTQIGPVAAADRAGQFLV